MASEADRLAKSEHNRRFLKAIRQPEYADWSATAAFYAALQLIESLLARKTTREPPARNRILQETRSF